MLLQLWTGCEARCGVRTQPVAIRPPPRIAALPSTHPGAGRAQPQSKRQNRARPDGRAPAGIFIADALSMPVHWYYNVGDIK